MDCLSSVSDTAGINVCQMTRDINIGNVDTYMIPDKVEKPL